MTAVSTKPPPGFIERTAKNSLSGTAAGIAVCLVGHPFDTLKVRLQTQPTHNPVYKGLSDCFFKTLRWEGIGGLYKGVASPIIGQMFFRATLFTSYYQVQDHLSRPDRVGKRLQTPEYFLCGAVTGFFASFFEGPIDLFKTKMQIEIIRAKTGAAPQYRHVFHAGYVIGQQHGIQGVYQGLGATLARNIPAFGVYFGVYEWMRKRLTPAGSTVTDLSVAKALLAGGTGGLFYWAAIYPIDVIKSSMQSDDIIKANRKYTSIVDCAMKLYREEGGLRRFFKGFTPCMMRSIPANATMLLVLEKCRQIFG